jgi:two-component system cell cycle sensor histidine kinase PleC
LNAIIGFSDLMKSETFGPLGHGNYRIYAEDIALSGRNLMGIVENILELTRIETNEVTLHETRFDVYECVKSVIANLQARKVITHSVPVRIEQAPMLPALVADKALISRGLAQLISNAVKFSADNGTVVVKLKRDAEGQFLIGVEDNGIGIEGDDVARLSQPFYQADSTLARKYQGLGLGVTLTKSIIAMHGGELRIASQPGRGTQMTLCLPAWRVSGTDGRPDSANGDAALAGAGEPAVAPPAAQTLEGRAP